MRWPDGALLDPRTRRPLRPDRGHALTDGTSRYPVVDRIPLLLPGRRDLLDELLGLLDHAEDRRARALLLFGARDVPSVADRLDALGKEATLRSAVAVLDPADDGMTAHAWSLPDHVAGVEVLRRHHGGGPVLEIGAGIGALARDLARGGVPVVACDADPIAMWLARRFVAPGMLLVAAEAGALPFGDATFAHTVLRTDRDTDGGGRLGAPTCRVTPDAVREATRVGLATTAVGARPGDVMRPPHGDLPPMAGVAVEQVMADLVARGVPRAPAGVDQDAEDGWVLTSAPPTGQTGFAAPAGISLALNPLLVPRPTNRHAFAVALPTPQAQQRWQGRVSHLEDVAVPDEHRRGGVLGTVPEDLVVRRVLVDLPERW